MQQIKEFVLLFLSAVFLATLPACGGGGSDSGITGTLSTTGFACLGVPSTAIGTFTVQIDTALFRV
ncbi:hypothetical protein N9H39_06595 [Gammaproteobacteria bacterium]|nr:hypothetical protein [Gammaproteobacteria bacterium]